MALRGVGMMNRRVLSAPVPLSRARAGSGARRRAVPAACRSRRHSCTTGRIRNSRTVRYSVGDSLERLDRRTRSARSRRGDQRRRRPDGRHDGLRFAGGLLRATLARRRFRRRAFSSSSSTASRTTTASRRDTDACFVGPAAAAPPSRHLSLLAEHAACDPSARTISPPFGSIAVSRFPAETCRQYSARPTPRRRCATFPPSPRRRRRRPPVARLSPATRSHHSSRRPS